MSDMRAKLRLVDATKAAGGTTETLTFQAVGREGGYAEDGLDENSTFSKFTPTATLTMQVTNPDLVGKFEAGQEFYVDFTRAG